MLEADGATLIELSVAVPVPVSDVDKLLYGAAEAFATERLPVLVPCAEG
jgi:hypothetical protein